MNTYRMYKYRAINKNSLDSLIKGSIYFSPINKLNDPIDSKVDALKSVANAAKLSSSRKEKKLDQLLKNKKFFEKFNQKTGEIGVCSFSLELKSVLMWSHYADEHKGMAILYEFPEAFLYDGEKFISTVKITYEENPLTNWFIKVANKLPIQKDNLNIELAMKYLTVKSPDWKATRDVHKYISIYENARDMGVFLAYYLFIEYLMGNPK